MILLFKSGVREGIYSTVEGSARGVNSVNIPFILTFG